MSENWSGRWSGLLIKRYSSFELPKVKSCASDVICSASSYHARSESWLLKLKCIRCGDEVSNYDVFRKRLG